MLLKIYHSLTFNFWCETICNLIQLQQSVKLEFLYSFIIKKISMFGGDGREAEERRQVWGWGRRDMCTKFRVLYLL